MVSRRVVIPWSCVSSPLIIKRNWMLRIVLNSSSNRSRRKYENFEFGRCSVDWILVRGFCRSRSRKPRPHEGHGDANQADRENGGKIGSQAGSRRQRQNCFSKSGPSHQERFRAVRVQTNQGQ